MKRDFALGAIVAGALLLAGCSATPPVEAIPTPAASEPGVVEKSATPTAEPAPVAEAGTRANPLAIGQTRLISEGSAWNLGAEAASQDGGTFVVLPLRISPDWAACEQQAAAQGASCDNVGLDPVGNLFVTYVTAGGASFDTMDDYQADVPNEFYEVGVLYPPAEAVSVNVPISVPADQKAGGVWRVQNIRGDVLFLASGL